MEPRSTSGFRKVISRKQTQLPPLPTTDNNDDSSVDESHHSLQSTDLEALDRISSSKPRTNRNIFQQQQQQRQQPVKSLRRKTMSRKSVGGKNLPNLLAAHTGRISNHSISNNLGKTADLAIEVGFSSDEEVDNEKNDAAKHNEREAPSVPVVSLKTERDSSVEHVRKRPRLNSGSIASGHHVNQLVCTSVSSTSNDDTPSPDVTTRADILVTVDGGSEEGLVSDKLRQTVDSRDAPVGLDDNSLGATTLEKCIVSVKTANDRTLMAEKTVDNDTEQQFIKPEVKEKVNDNDNDNGSTDEQRTEKVEPVPLHTKSIKLAYYSPVDELFHQVSKSAPRVVDTASKASQDNMTSLYDSMDNDNTAVNTMVQQKMSEFNDSHLSRYDRPVMLTTVAPGMPPYPELAQLRDVASLVPHLKSIRMEPKTKLPTLFFTVHSICDGHLYDFRIRIAKSLQSGAGKGAFLQLLRVRRLRDSSECTEGYSCKLSHDKVTRDSRYKRKGSNLKKPLPFKTTGGYCGKINLRGNDLDILGDHELVPTTLCPLQARIGENECVKVNLKGKYLHFDAESQRKALFAPLVGFAGMNTEFDYIDDDSGYFDSNSSSLYLGPYGPFYNSDLKTDDIFAIKDFVFSHIPSEWAMSADNAGITTKTTTDAKRGLNIDITSDVTGDPHERATNNIAMYVNEVGSDSLSRQNVYSRSHEGTAHYYIQLTESLRVGDEVELLTNYRQEYESIRERKGYGKRNIHYGLPSDEDFAYYCKRNHKERKDIHSLLQGFSVMRMYPVVEYLYEKIWQGLYTELNGDASVALKIQQWEAVVRIHWLKRVMMDRIEEVENAELSESEKIYKRFLEELVYYCKTSLVSMDTETLIAANYDNHERMATNKWTVAKVIRAQVEELIMYNLTTSLIDPLSMSYWCRTAVILVGQVVGKAAQAFLRRQPKSVSDVDLYTCAVASAQRMRSRNVADMEFTSGLEAGQTVSITSLQDCFTNLCGGGLPLTSDLFLDYTATPKGYMSKVIQLMHYYDSLELLDEVPVPIRLYEDIRRDERYVMVQAGQPTSDEGMNSLSAVPRVSRGCASSTVNTTWYVAWQVVYVSHCLATTLNIDKYSLDELCRNLDFDIRLAKFVVELGIKAAIDLGPLMRPRHAKTVITNMEEAMVCSDDAPKVPAKAQSRVQSSKNKKEGTEKKVRKSVNPKPKKTNVIRSGGSVSTENARPSALLVWMGHPAQYIALDQAKKFERTKLGRLNEVNPWPADWVLKIYKRQSGSSIGMHDPYWFTPKKNLKLRSMNEVLVYMKLLGKYNDESIAFQALKRGEK